MSIIAKASADTGFVPVPVGLHLARCYAVIDLGTQTSEWKGEVMKQRKTMLQFEVHGEDDDGNPTKTAKGEPMSISKNYTLSLGEKANLRKDLASWRGRDFTPDELRGFDLKNLLGVWAMISTVRTTGNNGKEYTNISGIMPVPAKIKAALPDGHNIPRIFSIEDPDMEIFDKFSDYLKLKIQSAPEWNQSSLVKNDDIPF